MKEKDGKKSADEKTAPPMEEMDKIPGYGAEIIAPTVKFVPPPPVYSEPTNNTESYATSGYIDQDEARRILIRYAKSKCCWRTGAAENMTFRSIQSSTAIHYVLKTFLETRSTDWKSVPYKGQTIDGPQNGTPPMPWAIEIPMPAWFHETTFKCEVPHTASVKPCHRCRGSGRIQCRHCHGSCHTVCMSCHGSCHMWINDQQVPCGRCHGSGRQICFMCHGSGKTRCPTCDGGGRLKFFIQLKAKFKNHTKDYILERTPLPDHLVRDATGKLLFEDTQSLLNPIQNYPEQEVNKGSANLIQLHRGLGKTGRIWMQNHSVRSVPVCQCDCAWQEDNDKVKTFQYFVYGNNHLVHAPEYPQQCCCAIL